MIIRLCVKSYALLTSQTDTHTHTRTRTIVTFNDHMGLLSMCVRAWVCVILLFLFYSSLTRQVCWFCIAQFSCVCSYFYAWTLYFFYRAHLFVCAPHGTPFLSCLPSQRTGEKLFRSILAASKFTSFLFYSIDNYQISQVTCRDIQTLSISVGKLRKKFYLFCSKLSIKGAHEGMCKKRLANRWKNYSFMFPIVRIYISPKILLHGIAVHVRFR